jgi:flagellar motor protein MotB
MILATMSDEAAAAPLTFGDVAPAVLGLAGQRELAGLVARFLETLRTWAAPSAVLAGIRDQAAAGGWRLLPALSAGSGPLGIERSLRQLVDELPDGLARPSLVRPGGDVQGARVRENCVVPWSCEGDSGVLVLRGVAESRPPNLADAVAVLATAVWPRLLGGPASRVEAGVAELGRLAERLRDDVARQLERLEAAQPKPVVEDESAPAPEPRAVELEQQLDSARRELDSAQRELEEAQREAQRHFLEREELEQQVRTLEKALGDAEDEHDRALRDAASRRDDVPAATPGGSAPASGEGALGRTLAAIRRAAYVPAGLRVAMREAEAMAGDAAGPKTRLRVVLLDRDAVSLEALAGELEENGIGVQIANHPEELTLLMKTPDGRGVHAAVCDVLAFRPDQNVAGLFRAWEKDRPGLALYLSFGQESATEVERAQRVPLSLTAGRFRRPLNRLELLELLEPLARRVGGA